MKAPHWIIRIGAPILMTLLPICANAKKGGSDGSGGQVLVCPSPNGKSTVTLLDLWEAKNITRSGSLIEAPDESPQTLKKMVAEGIQRLKFIFDNRDHWQNGNSLITGPEATVFELSLYADWFLTQTANLIPMRRARLKLTDDAYEVALPEDCELKQIVNWRGQSQIFVNMDLYDQLDNVNKTALILHEALYAMLRNYDETNSLRVRRAVGYVMTGHSFTSLAEKLGKKPRLICIAENESNLELSKRSKAYVVEYAANDEGPPYNLSMGKGVFPLIVSVGGIPVLGPDRSSVSVGESIQKILSAKGKKHTNPTEYVAASGSKGDLRVSATDFDSAAEIYFYYETQKLRVKLTKLAGQKRTAEAELVCRPDK